MCGLIAAISRMQSGFYSDDLDIFEQMSLINSVRGRDSVGFMVGHRNRNVSVIKHGVKHPTLTFETKDWRDMRSDAIRDGWFICGHNRAATRGEKSTDNAHPFVEDHIILMHNGTIFNQEQLADRKVEVDSNAIAIAMSKGTKEEVVKSIRGAFALIWYDTNTEELYAVRNEDRPLFLLQSHDFYYLSSEPWIAAGPLTRKGKKITQIDPIEPGKLVTFGQRNKMSITDIELAPKTVFTGAANSAGRFYKDMDWENYADDDFGDCRTPFPTGAGVPQETKTPNPVATQGQSTPRVCALTSTTTTSNDSTGKSVDSMKSGDSPEVTREIERIESLQRSIRVDSSEFPKGTPLLIKILGIQKLPNGVRRFQGKCRSPGRPMIDVTGILPHDLPEQDFALWIERMCMGKVNHYTVSNGGPMVFVRDVVQVPYTDVHGEDVPNVLWEYAKLEGCPSCQLPIQDWERPFTHLKLTASSLNRAIPKNELKIVCPDCLMKKLEGDNYDRYSEKYFKTKAAHLAKKEADSNSSVQDRKPISTEPVGKNGSVIVVPSSPTVH